VTARQALDPAFLYLMWRTGGDRDGDTDRLLSAWAMFTAPDAVDGPFEGACEDAQGCARPGAVIAETEAGSVVLCGLHAITVLDGGSNGLALSNS